MVRVRVFQTKFCKKFACLQFKFIKEILVRSEPKFHKPFLAKSAFYLLEKFQALLAFWQDFVIQPYYVEVASAMKFFARNAFAANFFIAKQSRIDRTTREIKQKYPQDAPWQKLSILLDEPRHTTICHYISSFDKISIKSSKKCDLLATLMKFDQTSNSHLPRQQKFVKTNAA